MTLSFDLIGKGYFPRELPPTFATMSLANHTKTIGLKVLNASFPSAKASRLLRHNLARPGGFRRVLGIPNPVHYLRLVEALRDGWISIIEPHLAATTYCSSRPTRPSGARAFTPLNTATTEARIVSRSSARVLLKTDVQNFYPSLYSHAVPWALHTKPTAKASRRDKKLLGNRLDAAVRGAQDDQTMGVPIGPDSSWILAECIMAAVDGKMSAALGPIRGHRYLDDIELCFKSRAEAENALALLQESLSEYELGLNPRKTHILELPDPVEDKGIAELRQWVFRDGAAKQRTDLIAYFDRVAELIAENRGGHIASYAVARLRAENVAPGAWKILVLQCLNLLVIDPSCALQVATTISLLVKSGHSVDPANLAEAVEQLITYHARLNHGSEVAWALWLSIAHNTTLSQSAATAVSTMDDDVVALLALHADQLRLFSSPLQTSHWQQFMTTPELNGDHWLLAYEASVKGWLPSSGGGDHIAANPFFLGLRIGGVSFYDENALTIDDPSPPFSFGGGGGGTY